MQNNVTGPSIANLIEVAGYAISVEVYPPAHEIPVGSGDGLKVLYGSIVLLNSNGKVADRRQPFSVPEFSAATTTISSERGVSDQKLGAVLLRLRPVEGTSDKYIATKFRSAEDVPVNTVLSLPAPYYKLAPLKFNKVDSLWWDVPFKGVDFFNLSGFHFQFITGSGRTAHSPLAHIQFWTGGKDVNCGVHNHAGDIFCQVHVSLSAGTGNGGMARLKPEYAKCPQDKYNDLGPEAFDHLPLKELEEHGGIWERGSDGKPVRANPAGVVKYPWHKWQAGNEADDVDVWMAIEFHPDVVDRAVDDGQKAGEIEHPGGRAIRKGGSLAMISEKDSWDDLDDVVMLV
ncbi:hypothetical protein F5Y10DRAFT_261964 [Nemania abortiva]|nr:hypothetical protein F5Y10DRAFT_261964 [Nemania abortiva]